VFEFTEEALDAVSVAVQEGAEGRDVLAAGHGFDVCPSAAFGECRAQGVAAGPDWSAPCELVHRYD
jgi:hypothetical protein